MLSKNVLNPNKKGKIEGRVFNLFYPDLNTSVLFDRDLSEPIIYGSKNVVMTTLKKIDELMNVQPEANVVIHSYIMAQEGFRRIQTYNGKITGIGKYIIRY